MSDTIELVRFRLKQGKTAADWLKANEKINEWIKVQPGFRFRSLSETDDGEWIDMVYWESLEAARASSAKFGEEMGSSCEPLVEMGSVVVSHSKAHVMQQGQERTMTKISILYPNTGKFDMGYYLNTHMPRSIELLSKGKGYRGVSVERGVGGASPGSAPAYVAMCHYLFDTAEDFMAACGRVAGRHTELHRHRDDHPGQRSRHQPLSRADPAQIARAGVFTMSNSPRFGFVVEYVKDIEAARHFYVDVMGLQVQRLHPTYVQFETFAVASDAPMGGETEQELFWLVDDAKAAFDDLSAKTEISMPLQQVPFGKVFGIRDQDARPRYILELAKNRPSKGVT